MPKSKQRQIFVVDYDSSWPVTFVSLRTPILESLRGISLAVEHVGSTSVPGLAAKPIIDIDAIIPSRAAMPAAIERLAALGYVHSGNLGIEDREAFGSPPGLPAHNLYACVQGSTALANHLTVRDCLRRNPSVAVAYGRLKKQLADQFPTDIESYIAGKTDFLLDVLQSAGFANAALRQISIANRQTSSSTLEAAPRQHEGPDATANACPTPLSKDAEG
jgi:GrpB-like predicted nucleotidyltransferase (UPF0157 family)